MTTLRRPMADSAEGPSHSAVGAAMRRFRSGSVVLAGDESHPARLLLLFVLTQLASVAWDLLCPHGWENDGAAPRDLLGGPATGGFAARARARASVAEVQSAPSRGSP